MTTHSTTPVTESDYEAKQAWIRAMLMRLDAVIIACQELWSRECLDDVLGIPEFAGYTAVYIGLHFTYAMPEKPFS